MKCMIEPSSTCKFREQRQLPCRHKPTLLHQNSYKNQNQVFSSQLYAQNCIRHYPRALKKLHPRSLLRTYSNLPITSNDQAELQSIGKMQPFTRERTHITTTEHHEDCFFTLAEPMSFLLAASLIAFCTFFSSLWISENRTPPDP